MKKTSYCKSCEAVKPCKKVLSSKKQYDSGWLLLLFDVFCKKCNTVTWKQFEASAPLENGGRAVLMSVTNVNYIDLEQMFEELHNAVLQKKKIQIQED